MNIKNCEYCTKKETCNKSIGFMFGGCSTEFKADTEKIYKQLDNLEGCEANEVYSAKIRELRALL